MLRALSNRLALILSLLGCLTIGGWAQSGSGTGLRGWVADPLGHRVPGAGVEAVSGSTGEKRSASTDAEGYFEMRSLPMGTYRLSVAKQ